MARLDLTVHVSTKLNRSHVVTGRRALILPTLGRTDRDRRGGLDQRVSVEDSMGAVHASRGRLTPPADDLLSEVAIVARLCALLFDADSGANVPRADWAGLETDYARIRSHIQNVVPGFDDYERRIEKGRTFFLPNGPRDARQFATSDGRAHFTVNPLEYPHIPRDVFCCRRCVRTTSTTRRSTGRTTATAASTTDAASSSSTPPTSRRGASPTARSSTSSRNGAPRRASSRSAGPSVSGSSRTTPRVATRRPTTPRRTCSFRSTPRRMSAARRRRSPSSCGSSTAPTHDPRVRSPVRESRLRRRRHGVGSRSERRTGGRERARGGRGVARGRVPVRPGARRAGRGRLRGEGAARGARGGRPSRRHDGRHGDRPSRQTPEGTARVLTRELPGIAEELRRIGAAVKPAGLLSRGRAGVVDPEGALIVNLPGSPSAVAEGMPLILALAGHVLDQLGGGDHA